MASVTQKYFQELDNFRRSFEQNGYIEKLKTDRIERDDLTHFTNAFLHFFQTTFLAEARKILGPPPCHYEIVAMGSVAREEICPFSDLELFILIEERKYFEYFNRFVKLLEMLALCFGESLNEYHPVRFTSLAETKSLGFHFDKSEFDLTREIFKESPQDYSVESSFLICLPAFAAKYVAAATQWDDFRQRSTLANTMHKGRVIASSEGSSLFTAYQEQLLRDLAAPIAASSPDGEQLCEAHRRASYLFHRHQTDYEMNGAKLLRGVELDLKTAFIHPIHLLITDLSISFFNSPEDPFGKTNTLDIIDRLSEVFDAESRDFLKSAVCFLHALRITLHQHYGKPCDQVTIPQEDQLKRAAELVQDPSNSYRLSLEQAQQLDRIQCFILEPLYAHLSKGFQHSRWWNLSFVDLILSEMAQWVSPYSSEQRIRLSRILRALVIFQEDFQMRFYQQVSLYSKLEPVRESYIDLLETLNQPELLRHLLHIPNPTGYRQKDRVARRDLCRAI